MEHKEIFSKNKKKLSKISRKEEWKVNNPVLKEKASFLKVFNHSKKIYISK